MTNPLILKSFTIAFLLFLSLASKAQDNEGLLSIYELTQLEHYYVMHDDSGKVVVLVDKEWKHMESFSFVESAIFAPNPNYIDTFDFAPEQFPNLKSAQFRDLYFDQLIGISKFKNLQYLDIGSLNYVEHMHNSYVLNFPEEFWSLKKLQILNVFCSQLSDFSESIQQLESLKILNTGTHHGDKDQLVIPWSLLLMPEFCVLNVSYNVNQEEFELFRKQAHFTVTNDAFTDIINQLKPDLDVREVFQKEVSYKTQGNRIILKNDSLQLTIPLTEDHSSINGKATLTDHGKVIQRRNYKSGVGHGKWSIRNSAGTQKRRYTSGTPIGRWTYKNPRQRFRNQSIQFEKNTSNFRVKGNLITSKIFYRDYNHEYHFQAMNDYFILI